MLLGLNENKIHAAMPESLAESLCRRTEAVIAAKGDRCQLFNVNYFGMVTFGGRGGGVHKLQAITAGVTEGYEFSPWPL